MRGVGGKASRPSKLAALDLQSCFRLLAKDTIFRRDGGQLPDGRGEACRDVVARGDAEADHDETRQGSVAAESPLPLKQAGERVNADFVRRRKERAGIQTLAKEHVLGAVE